MQYKNPSYTKNTSSTRRSIKKRLFLLAAILLVVGGVLAVLELTDTTHLFHQEKPTVVSGGPGTKGVDISDTSTDLPGKQGSSEDTDTSANQSDKQPGENTKKLTALQGPFVSHHDSSDEHRSINSACSTTSGAICQIIFTKDGVTKTLPAQMTDLGGATYWNGWEPKDIGLTAGKWKVTAKATLGSQIETAADALPLQVAP